MKQVASLRYGVIFKKAFADPQIFTAFVRDFVGVAIEIDKVETEKSFDPPIGQVAVEFDLYAEDKKNRIIVDIQHERYIDHYDRFLHYQCAAILQQIANANDYSFPEKFCTTSSSAKMGQNFSGDLDRPQLSVYTLVVLTSGDKHQQDISIIDFDPHTLRGEALGEIPHKVFFICPKYVNDETPVQVREWLRAIDDSLDEQVDEAQYTYPEIQRIFDIIEKDLVTPSERARMFEESHQEELKQTAFAEGREEGEQRKASEIARALLAEGTAPVAVSRITGLTVEQVQALRDA